MVPIQRATGRLRRRAPRGAEGREAYRWGEAAAPPQNPGVPPGSIDFQLHQPCPGLVVLGHLDRFASMGGVDQPGELDFGLVNVDGCSWRAPCHQEFRPAVGAGLGARSCGWRHRLLPWIGMCSCKQRVWIAFAGLCGEITEWAQCLAAKWDESRRAGRLQLGWWRLGSFTFEMNRDTRRWASLFRDRLSPGVEETCKL